MSVVIPCFNGEKFIAHAINSVLRQSLENIEVIVCDDCSTDGSVQVIEGIAKLDNRVHLIQNNVNSGPSFSRNCAINFAKGQWIALLDSDDYYEESRLEQLTEIGANTKADLVADNIAYVDMKCNATGNLLIPENSNPPIFTLTSEQFILNDMPVYGGARYGYLKPLIRRSFLVETGLQYEKSIQIGEDFFLYLQCLIAGAKFVVTQDNYYFYRIVPGSLSRTGDGAKIRELCSNNQRLIEICSEKNKLRLVMLLKRRQKIYKGVIRYTDCVRELKKGSVVRFIMMFVLSNPRLWFIMAALGFSRFLDRIDNNPMCQDKSNEYS